MNNFLIDIQVEKFLSIVAGAGAVFVHHVAGSWVEKHVDKVADKAIDTVAKAGHKATNAFFSLF